MQLKRFWKVRNSLIWQFFVVVSILLFVILLDILITNSVIKSIIQKNTVTSNEKIMQQIDAKTKEFYNSIFNIMTLVSYEQTTYNYFTQDSLDRINNYDDLVSILSNTMMISEDIAGIAMYDHQMNKVVSQGKRFDHFQKVSMVEGILFSDIFRANSSSDSYYTVSYPVYDIKNQNYNKKIGLLVFLMKTNRFSTYLQDARMTLNSHVYLLDTQNAIIAFEGDNKADILAEEKMANSKHTYVKVIKQKDTGWSIVSIIPVKELSDGMDTVKSAIFVTYLITFLSLILLIYFCYLIILRPLHKVDLFVKRSVENPLERVKINGTNEISKLADNLNHMLDERDAMNEKLRHSQRIIYETELTKKQMQVLAYRNQINPHFLYNTFECIRAMALYYDVDDIAEITMALSKVFRYAIKGENIVSVQDEINYIREYAKIINYRFAGKIQIELDVAEEALSRKVIKLILQPIVENSVFHGLEEKLEDGFVRVKVSALEGGKLQFVVSDNGCGMEEDKLEKIMYRMKRHSMTKSAENDSIGLMNIYQRLRLFYGADMALTVKSAPNMGTTVEITVLDNLEKGDEERDV